jgi:hypothetical protein
MYARSTTVRGHPGAIDVGIAYVREWVMPTVRELDGCVGISMLVDRESGRSVITTSWVDLESMKRSAQFVEGARRRTAEILVGSLEVQEWEITLVHRHCGTRDRACTRVMWTRGDPGQIDHVVDSFRMTLLPQLDELPGFCSLSMMVDRTTGRYATAATYENRRAMEEATEQAALLRRRFTQAMGMEIEDVASFELALAHLRVPETA